MILLLITFVVVVYFVQQLLEFENFTILLKWLILQAQIKEKRLKFCGINLGVIALNCIIDGVEGD